MMHDRNWTYVRLFYPTLGHLDSAVADLADDDSMGTVLADAPWFYLRFVDSLGPQLRLRSCGSAAQRSHFIDATHEWYRRTRDQARAEVDVDVDVDETFGRWGVDVGSYRPEIDKYGTAEAVRSVEDHWIEQCPVLLSTWATDTPKQRRVALFALVADVVYAASGSADDQIAALRQHAWFWLRSTIPSLGPQATFVQRVAAQTVTIKRSSLPPLVAALAGGLTATIAHVADIGRPGQPAHHRFNLLHIVANRLGLSPVEEGFTLLAVAEMRNIERRTSNELRGAA